MPRPIAVNVCISGLTQTEARPHGIFNLSEKLIENGYNSESSRVHLLPWSHDWAGYAERLWLIGQRRNCDLMINVYAYSWGVGFGALNLARELANRGIPIRCLVASDGVYRSPLKSFLWLSMLSRDWTTVSPTIRFPENVEHGYAFHQSKNRPCGHRIYSGDWLIPSTELDRTHQYMDDAPEFHDRCLIEARNTLETIAEMCRW